MAVVCKTGSFLLNNTTGNQTITTGATDVGKAIIFFGTNQTATGYNNGMSGFFGAATNSTSRGVIAWASDNAVATTNVGEGNLSNNCIYLFSGGTPTVDAFADFVSFGTGASAGQFTINIGDAPTSNVIVNYVFLGGSDITNATVVKKTQATATGAATTTGVGFQGTAAIFFGTAQTSEGTLANTNVFIGAAVDDNNGGISQGLVSIGSNDAVNTNPVAEYYQASTNCIGVFSGRAINSETPLTAFTSDGYTLSWPDAATSAWIYYGLIIKGGIYSIDAITAPASTGDQSIAAGFTPKGVFYFGAGETGNFGSEVTGASITLSSMDNSGNMFGAWTGMGTAYSVNAASRTVNTKVLIAGTPLTTTDAEASYKSMDANGYTVTWSTVTSGAKFFGLSVGSAFYLVGNVYYSNATAVSGADVYVIKETSVGTLSTNTSWYTTSNSTGGYKIQVTDGLSQYFAVAFKNGTPMQMDVSIRTLNGVEVA